jgi:3-oxoacyl-[acyl-carrier-protein] synthase-3
MGFIYGLQIAGSLLLSINKPYGLFVVGDTISKQLSYDKAQSMIYGDGASAVLLGKNDGAERINTLSNSQGDGYDKYYLPEGGFRDFKSLFEVNRNIRSQNIKMYEQEYFSFVKEILPKSINRFMDKHQSSIKNFDFLALHQEHAEVLSGLCKKLNIDFKHLPSNINKYGNSSGNSIPLLLTDYFGKAKNKEKIKVLAIAYGEGFSWGMASFSINTNNIFPLLESDEYYDDAKVSHDF